MGGRKEKTEIRSDGSGGIEVSPTKSDWSGEPNSRMTRFGEYDDGGSTYFSVASQARRGSVGSYSTSAGKRTNFFRRNSGGARTISYLKQLSLQVDEEAELHVDVERLRYAVEETGTYASDVAGVEVWVLDEEHTGRLIRPDGGWWRDPSMTSNEMAKLENPLHPNYIPPAPTMPGVNMVGELWAESSNRRIFHFQRPRVGVQEVNATNGVFDQAADYDHEPLRWRCIQSLLADPDTPKTPRLKQLDAAGFGMAAAVSFDVGGSKGILMFLSAKGAKNDRLRWLPNEMYMTRCAALVGTVLSMSDARRATVAMALQEAQNAARISGDKPKKENKKTQKVSLANGSTTCDEESCSYCEALCTKFKVYISKFGGGNLQPPPPMALQEALFTLFGCLVSMIFFKILLRYIPLFMGGDGGFHLVAPIGSLITMHYGLPAAPAAQPRNVILGQVVAGGIATLFTYIPDNILVPMAREVVAPAVAITAMVKVGLTHPPAGASAVILSMKYRNWELYACVLLMSTLTLIPAVLINNLSQRRQYPTYWGFLPSLLQKKAKLLCET